MEWTNEKIIRFLELYKAQPIIWDSAVKGHKDRKCVYNAWKEIADKMGEMYTVKELKNKKNSLMASYRLYRKKVKDSKRSGAGDDEVYKPTWFAYPILDQFLGKKDEPLGSFNTADVTDKVESSEVDEPLGEEKTMIHQNSPGKIEPNAGVMLPTKSSSTSFLQHASKRQRYDEKDELRKQMYTAPSIIETSAHKPLPGEKDECDLYGDLIAMKLRKLNEEDRATCMIQIDNLIFTFISKNFNSPMPTSLRFPPHVTIPPSHSLTPSGISSPSSHSFPPSTSLNGISSSSPSTTTTKGD